MVFIGGSGWRRRRRGPGYGPPPGYDPRYPEGYDPRYPPGYGQGYDPRFAYRRGWGGGGGGGSCLRDALLVEGGCCLAESLGCGPQLLFVARGVSPFRARRLAAIGSDEDLGHGSSRLVGLLLSWIATYQREVSPRRGACCRYSPTCSHYAADALRRHGLVRGLWLTARRLLRCRPGAVGGPDPVPGPGRAERRAT